VEDQFTIIEVPADATLASIQTKLEQAQDKQIVLRLNGNSRALSGPIQFTALGRCAAHLGLSLFVVTRDPRYRSWARLAGLPAFSSTEAAQSANHNGHELRPSIVGLQTEDDLDDLKERLERKPPLPRRTPSAVRPRRRIPHWLSNLGRIVFLLGLAGIVYVAALYLVPLADITLVPAREQLVSSVPITADRSITTADLGARLIPARSVSVDVEGSSEVATSGTRNAPADKAKGKVVFINRRAQETIIPPGVIVGTSSGDNIRFQTLVTATLPAGINSTAEAEVEAIDPGPRGNVRAFTINSVEGSVGLLVRVVNEQATEGGNLAEVAVVTQEDKDRLRAATERQLQQAAYTRLAETLKAGEFVPPETVGTVVLAETFDRFAGEVTPVLRMKLRVRARGLAVDGDSARTIAQNALTALVPPEGHLLAADLKIQPGPITSASDDRVQFSMDASGFIVRQIDTAAVRQLLYGLAITDAITVLHDNLALQEAPQITVGPDWYVQRYGLMPLIPWRIRIHVRYADASQ
jgi:hypothetical protein